MEKMVFSVSTIEENLKRSIIAQYETQIDKIILSGIKSKTEGDNMTIPNIDSLCTEDNLLPELGVKLIEKYNSCFSPIYSNVIPDAIKIEQAAMLDSLMFGYNLNTGKINLYTLNIGVLFGLGIDNDKIAEKCFERNCTGIIHAYRIDMEYMSERRFQFKAVSLNKNSLIYTNDFVLFPYTYIDRCSNILKTFMNKGYVLKLTQDLGDLLKVRYVTRSETVLKKYCDSEEAISSVRASYFPLKGFMYLPVVGAPSTTSMITRVDLFSLTRLDPVRSYKEIGVRKVSNPVRNTVVINSIMKRLIELNKEGSWDYEDILSELPDGDKVFKDEFGRGLINVVLLSKYLHTLSEETLEDVVKMIPGCPEVVNLFSKLIVKNEFVDFSNMSRDEIRKCLSEGIYTIVFVSSRCKYSSMTVTNNRKILKQIYGDDYFARYEGTTVKLNELRYRISVGMSVEDSLAFCGFPLDEELIEKANEFKSDIAGVERGTIEYNVANQRFKDDIISAVDVSPREEASTGSILVRTCFATINPDDTVSDFYRYLSIPKIVRAIRLG